MPSYRIGVDVGGTFTDLVLLQEETGEILEIKVLTTSPNPADGVIKAVNMAMNQARINGESVQSILHGTTMATNSLIERKGARTALLTTKGFRDVLEIGRQIRPSLFDWTVEKPLPLVPRKWRYELNERVKSDGAILASPREEEIEEIAQKLLQDQIESVAISFLFSFQNKNNEEKVAAVLRKNNPDFFISLSSHVLPEYGEYERTSTTCANAFITPILNRYIKKLDEDLLAFNLSAKLKLLQSNGGIGTVQALQDNWITTALSGPAGGVTAATHLARLQRISNAISMDIGGTSCDTCLLKDGLPGWTTESSVGGLPIRTPMIEVKSIGAGGGSLIWVDSGGALRVGPHSCGSHPGPVCYGLGGTEPAITDAHVLIGTLLPKYFLQKGIQIDKKKAEEALSSLGSKIGLSPEEAAAGAIEVMNHNIAQSIRMQGVTKGYDLGSFSLIAFGGAGPLHACFIADELGIRRILLPDFAGVFSALGASLADYRYDFAQAHPSKMDLLKEKELVDIFSDLMARAAAKLKDLPTPTVKMDRILDLRYVGQSFDIHVPLQSDLKDPAWKEKVSEQFHRLHEEVYGYCDRKEPVELVNLRLSCFALTPKTKLVNKGRTVEKSANGGMVQILSPAKRQREAYTFFDKAFLKTGEEIIGPCIILSQNSTAIVPRGWRGPIDENGTIILEKRRQE
ncbi:MAG: hydantoinase/oxoprolinase family protein [Deltaproteobacteria bacterium]|nr:hydantoinase/oxoprolinase family protein [Deltaproteobacteria bacterium]